MASKAATHPTPVTDFALATTGPGMNADHKGLLKKVLEAHINTPGFDPNGNVLTTG